MTESLKLSANENIAKFIATNIEQAANRLQPYERDNRAYIEKVRSLVFNLKENTVSQLATASSRDPKLTLFFA
jgi:hypothetical protein